MYYLMEGHRSPFKGHSIKDTVSLLSTHSTEWPRYAISGTHPCLDMLSARTEFMVKRLWISLMIMLFRYSVCAHDHELYKMKAQRLKQSRQPHSHRHQELWTMLTQKWLGARLSVLSLTSFLRLSWVRPASPVSSTRTIFTATHSRVSLCTASCTLGSECMRELRSVSYSFWLLSFSTLTKALHTIIIIPSGYSGEFLNVPTLGMSWLANLHIETRG